MEIINLGVEDELPPVDWKPITETLAAGSPPAPDAHNARSTWLTTLNEDGSPHVTAVGALWLDGAFWFQTGAVTRKSHNIARIHVVRSPCRSVMRTSSSRATRHG